MKIPTTEELERATISLMKHEPPAPLIASEISIAAARSELLTGFVSHHNGIPEALFADGVLIGLRIAAIRLQENVNAPN
jgi:hypothetical protein